MKGAPRAPSLIFHPFINPFSPLAPRERGEGRASLARRAGEGMCHGGETPHPRSRAPSPRSAGRRKMKDEDDEGIG